jgi:hypothetical protein
MGSCEGGNETLGGLKGNTLHDLLLRICVYKMQSCSACRVSVTMPDVFRYLYTGLLFVCGVFYIIIA